MKIQNCNPLPVGNIRKKEGNTTRHDLKKVEKEIKHWKNKMDNVGETHHRR